MRNSRPLNPGGAGRARWAEQLGRGPAFSPELLRACDAAELDRAVANRSQEVASWLPAEADGETRRHVALLTLALLLAVERGSTRVGVVGAAGDELKQLVGELELSAERVSGLRAWAAGLQGHVESGALGAVLRAAPRVAPLVAVAMQESERSPDTDKLKAAPEPDPAHPDRAPLLLCDGYVYPERLFATESRVARHVAARLHAAGGRQADAGGVASAPLEEGPLRALRDVLAAPAYAGDQPIKLSKEQGLAVRVAATAPLALVSGGPGTGKTSIVVSLLRVLVRLGLRAGADIALAAPTGKAADRMRSSVEKALRALRSPTFDDLSLLREPPQSQTLHRLLGFSPRTGRYRAHERSPLGVRVVIVDEASMIDVTMMDRLLRALRPETRLILLGDADQLPSVDAGAVFRDLCALPHHAVVRLTHSYRMDARDPAGRNILSVARAVHRGRTKRLFSSAHTPAEGSGASPAHEGLTCRASSEALRFWATEWLPVDHPAGRQAFLARWAEVQLRAAQEHISALPAPLELVHGRPESQDEAGLRELFVALEANKLLCMTRGGGTGVEHINAHYHRLRARSRSSRAAAETSSFMVGEPVMVHRNDYARGLFNGDTGVVLRGRFHDEPAPRRVVVFRRDEGFVGFPLNAIAPLLELAYAITVHKSQGSEYERVALILPDEDTPLLSREILYTAITRSRKSVVLVGPKLSIERAIGRRVARSSGLHEVVLQQLAMADLRPDAETPG